MTGVVITAWSALTPFGHGRAAFADGVRRGAPAPLVSTKDDWAEADLAFHEAVLHATNNELMISLFSVIETALGTYFVLSASTASNFKYSLPHHQKVYEAIRRRQPEVARQAMLKMVADSRSNIRRHRKAKA